MRRRRVGFRCAWTAVSRQRAGRRVPGIELLSERLIAVVNPKSCSGAVRRAAHADTPTAGKTPDRRTGARLLGAGASSGIEQARRGLGKVVSSSGEPSQITQLRRAFPGVRSRSDNFQQPSICARSLQESKHARRLSLSGHSGLRYLAGPRLGLQATCDLRGLEIVGVLHRREVAKFYLSIRRLCVFGSVTGLIGSGTLTSMVAMPDPVWTGMRK